MSTQIKMMIFMCVMFHLKAFGAQYVDYMNMDFMSQEEIASNQVGSVILDESTTVDDTGNPKIHKMIVTGNAATAFVSRLVQPQLNCNKFTYSKPQIIPLLSKKLFLSSSITKVSSDQDVYVLSRHALTRDNLDTLIKNFSEYHLFEVIENNSSTVKALDVIFISKSLESLEYFLNIVDKPKSSSWISWQYGSIDSKDLKDSTEQCSEGRKILVEIDNQSNGTGYYELPLGSNNVTSPASSGALIFSVINNETLSPWGIVQCVRTADPRNMQEKYVHVLGFDKIKTGFIRQIKGSEIDLKRRIQIPEVCAPVDKNGIGGDYTSGATDEQP